MQNDASELTRSIIYFDYIVKSSVAKMNQYVVD